MRAVKVAASSLRLPTVRAARKNRTNYRQWRRGRKEGRKEGEARRKQALIVCTAGAELVRTKGTFLRVSLFILRESLGKASVEENNESGCTNRRVAGIWVGVCMAHGTNYH